MLTAVGPDEVFVAVDVAEADVAVPFVDPVAAAAMTEVIVVLALMMVDVDDDASA